MSLVFCIISILQEFPYFASAISLDFAGFFRFFPLLFTHACPATEFCRCFAFQIGKICCRNCIVRNFQFRKFLPVYSNIFPRFSQLRNCFSTKSSVSGCVLRISRNHFPFRLACPHQSFNRFFCQNVSFQLGPFPLHRSRQQRPQAELFPLHQLILQQPAVFIRMFYLS